MNKNVFISTILFTLMLILMIPTKKTLTKPMNESLGDLTRQKPIEVMVKLEGKLGESNYFVPNKLNFFTGRLYKLIIINKSKSPHYFSSNGFIESIFTRKVQILKNEKKVAEIKGNIHEIEVFPDNIVEWWFVPVKTGIFTDLQCGVYDQKKKKKHSEMGMKGSIIIQ